MLSRKVIAMQVANLTDARYFAARGVDYLLFDVDQVSLEHIIEIKEWVEGPLFLLLFSTNTLSLVDEFMIKLSPEGIGGKSKEVIDEIAHLQSHTEIFSWTEQEIRLEDHAFKSISSASELLHLNAEEGVIIKGGSEDAVGVKAFDELDEILDQLED